MRIAMLGPPGAGKGTQAKAIAQRLDVPHISTGDIFRAARADGSDLGKQVSEYLDRGELVPDDLTVAVVERRLMEDDCADGFILDGFPRSVAQAQALDRISEERGTGLTHLINVQASEDAIVRRLTARRSCSQCGAVYNMVSQPPMAEGTCDTCGGDLVLRKDDNVETIRTRLSVYAKQTEPLVSFYEERGLLLTVDGEKAPDAVTGEIMRALLAQPVKDRR